MELYGTIKSIDQNQVTLVIDIKNNPDAYQYIKKHQVRRCKVGIYDGREISLQQRKFIYGLLGDISRFTGYTADETKIIMKYYFIEKTGAPFFSLRNVDKTTARRFLEFIIEFCIRYDIPTSRPLLKVTPDIQKYVYLCMQKKICVITQKPAELHHVDAVGRGRDRKEIIHIGYRVLPLCREMHTLAHSMGNIQFLQRYKLEPIRLNKQLCELWNVRHTTSKLNYSPEKRLNNESY